jgi:hypothetical protein
MNRTYRLPPAPAEQLSNVCFGKIEVGVIVIPIDAIDVGNAGKSVFAVGQARGPLPSSEAVFSRG